MRTLLLVLKKRKNKMTKQEENNQIDDLAKAWRKGNLTRKQESYTVTKMCDIYISLIKRQTLTDASSDKEEVMALYNIAVVDALNKWKGDIAFKGYLYQKIRYVAPQYFRDGVSVVKNAKCLSVPNDIIDCTNMNEYFKEE